MTTARQATKSVQVSIAKGIGEDALAWYERNGERKIASLKPAERVALAVAISLRAQARERKETT